MTNRDEQDIIPVPRTRIFVLEDGSFVVQWEENRVQELMSGRYFPYNSSRYGTAISDWELNQLQNSGVVHHYDDELVHLSPVAAVSAQAPSRTYYINTTLPKSEENVVREALTRAQLGDKFSVRIQEIFVIIRGPSGVPFSSFDDAERFRLVLLETVPDLFADSVIAFVEVNPVL